MRFLDALARDIRFAGRLMRQTPVVTGVAMLSLALGIGANVAIFSLVNALMLKALPIHEPERLANIVQPPSSPGEQPMMWFTYPQWEYLRDHQDFFSGIAATSGGRFNLNRSGELRPVAGLYASGSLFQVLGVTPHIGRVLTVADDRRGGGDAGLVAVLSHAFWQREYGGDAAVLGRPIFLDGHAFTIVGVTPPSFFGVVVGRRFDVAIPYGAEPVLRGAESTLDRRSTWWINLFARLAPGQTFEQAAARLDGLRPALRDATMPQNWRPQDQAEYFSRPFDVVPAATGLSGLRDRYSQPLFVLLGIVGLVLLIACANMANLLLAQVAGRGQELAIRLSLGATRAAVARQLLVESLLLSAAGAAAGVLLALWGSRGLVQLLSTRANLVSLDLALDGRVLAFTVGIGVLTGLLFGVAPAWRATGLAPAGALREGSRGLVGGGSRFSLGNALVAVQVALSFVLVLGASVFVRTLVDLTTQEMGFQANRVLVASVDLRRAGLADTERPATFERLREAIAAAPGVEAAAVSVVTPVSGSTWNDRITVPGYDAPERDRTALFNRVTPDYFRVMGTPILSGRDIGPTDRLGAPTVVLVNEAFARKFFRGESPLGRTFAIAPDLPRGTTAQVVGLVADAKYRTLREAPQPTMYAAWAQEDKASSSALITVRVGGSANAFRPTVLRAIEAVHPEAVVDFRTLEEDLNASITQERLVATLSAFFGGLALLLAVIGLYGVMSYSVSRRRGEIGIRLALGAAPERVMRQVFGTVATIVVAGLALGTAASLGAGRFVNALLFNLVATDLTMIGLAAVALALAGGLAGYLPARRAARVDPMVALRES